MFDTIIDKINKGTKQQILAFFILWLAIYGTAWTIAEPLNLHIVLEKTCLWRWVFIGTTFLVTICIYFSFFFRRKLERVGLEPGDTNLLETLKSTGSPKLSLQNDGFHGKVLNVIANFGNDHLNWDIKASANKAVFLTLIFKPEPDLMFYARVNVLSKNKKGFNLKWLRFEPSMSLPQSIEDHEEMGVPVTASDDNGLLHINVNLVKTISNAFGNHGWRYDKVISIRSRGSGKIKNIILK
jgi:hypothetical protein